MKNFPGMSEAASLALHTAALLAAREGKRLTTTQIASTLGASANHLAKVLQRLVHEGMVISERGPHGGFRLARNPAAMTLLEIYEAVEGTLKIQHCMMGRESCSGRDCVMGSLVPDLSGAVRKHLTGTKLSRVAEIYKLH